MIRASRILVREARKIVFESISRNAFCAHSENVVLTMLNDDNESIRQDGWERVLLARYRPKPSNQIRKFRVPPINIKCSSYLDLIDLEKAVDTDPPVVRKVIVSSENIKFLASKKILQHDFGVFLKHMPLHTQSVERCVNLVTAASKSVCGEQARNGYIANTLASRNEMPAFHSKQDFKCGGSFEKLSV